MSTELRSDRGLIETLNHELRGPLAPLANGIQILKLRSLDPAHADPTNAQTLAMMERQVMLLKQILDQRLG